LDADTSLAVDTKKLADLLLLFRQALQFLPGLEADRFAGGNVHFFAGARIASDPGFPRFHGEYAEAPQLDTLAASHAVFERLKNRFYCLLGFHATDVRAFQFAQHCVDNVQFDQTFLRNLLPPLPAPLKELRALSAHPRARF